RRKTSSGSRTLAAAKPFRVKVNGCADFDLEIVTDGEAKPGRHWREQCVVVDRDGCTFSNCRTWNQNDEGRDIGNDETVICSWLKRPARQVTYHDGIG